jgi:hypothetical protein
MDTLKKSAGSIEITMVRNYELEMLRLYIEVICYILEGSMVLRSAATRMVTDLLATQDIYKANDATRGKSSPSVFPTTIIFC